MASFTHGKRTLTRAELVDSRTEQQYSSVVAAAHLDLELWTGATLHGAYPFSILVFDKEDVS